MTSSLPAPRALSGLSLSASVLVATVAAVGCSSPGSDFDTGAGGSSPTLPSGGDTSNTTQSMGGSGGMPGGGQAAGGDGQAQAGAAPGGGAPAGGSGGLGGTSNEGGGGGSGGGDVGPTCPKPAGKTCHTFIVNDNARNVVTYVDEFDATKPNGVVWSKSVGVTGANSPRAIEIVDNAKAPGGKAVLVSVDNGYMELGLEDGAKLAQVTVNFSGITGACRMPDGNTALGTNAAIRIVGPTGAEVRQLALPAGSELRAINRHPTTGNFWFSKVETIYEVTEQGQTVWDANMGAGTKGYAVWWRPGGGAYASTGDPSTVVEIDASGKIVGSVGGKARFNFLDFFSGFSVLPNGHFVVANWLGHLAQPAADAPHVVELSKDNEVVWQWGDQTLARQVTNVHVVR